MESCMFPLFSTASIPAWLAWQWIQTWKLRYVCGHWKTRRKRIQASAEQLSTVTEEASTPAGFIGTQSINMASDKAWTARVEDAMIMPAVKACGPEWNQSCYMTAMILRRWARMNWKPWSGDISSAIGITGGSVLLMEGFLPSSNDSDTMILWKKQHRIQNPWEKCVN